MGSLASRASLEPKRTLVPEDWRIAGGLCHHQGASRGLYLATHALAQLYTREEAPARFVRQALVGLGERFTPFKRAVAASLTGLH